ncbi:MAG: class I SAM-dependent rRNA methyltransferase [Deltaproteobacteria bacterium]|nr:class I SAM-dependent rRNA methyltransferase [Deltaproteobacteria bacterium]
MVTAVIHRPSRILSNHLWVFSNELAGSPKAYEPGSLVELRDRKNNFLGIGYINPNSLIAVRVLTREKEEIDEAFFRRRIKGALDYRKRFIKETNAFRAVYSESDLLPGLIVDKYDDCLSVQILTLGMERWTDTVVQALDEIFSPRVIVLRNDSSTRTLEGLQMEKRVVKGSLDTLPVITDRGVKFEIDPMSGQKTGFFLDQAENREAFGSLAADGAGVDLFCYAGAWSIKAAQKGAVVLGVDSSEPAIERAAKNAGLNGLSDRCSFIKADVFDFVKDEIHRGSRYDFVVLDPPAFVKSKTKISEALRAYRDLNASSMRLLKDRGLLATSSCSYHIDRPTFMEMLRSAARDAGRQARIIESRSQAKDHPVSLSVPETEYLKCVILEVI